MTPASSPRQRRHGSGRAGDHVDDRIADQSILVVRVDDDEIRAFHNSSRHRGTRLAEGCGSLADGHLTVPVPRMEMNLLTMQRELDRPRRS